MARIPIRDATHWHELRLSRIGASEVAALFGCGYQTHFELWHEKRGDLPHADYADNERMVLGQCLEDGIAKAASELHGYELIKATDYFTDDACEGLGCTPDAFLIRAGRELPAEIKNASWGAYRDQWIVHPDGFAEPPLKFSLQLQVQLACCSADEGLLIALVSGDRLVRAEIPRHEAAIAEIRRRVRAFWDSIENNIEPPAEMPGDYDAAARVWRGGDGFADLRGDDQIENWLTQMRLLRDTKTKVETDIELIRGEVLSYCTNNKLSSIDAGAGRISCKWRDAQPERMVKRAATEGRHELRITTK